MKKMAIIISAALLVLMLAVVGTATAKSIPGVGVALPSPEYSSAVTVTYVSGDASYKDTYGYMNGNTFVPEGTNKDKTHAPFTFNVGVGSAPVLAMKSPGLLNIPVGTGGYQAKVTTNADGTYNIGFEDVLFLISDRDYNDVILNAKITTLPGTGTITVKVVDDQPRLGVKSNIALSNGEIFTGVDTATFNLKNAPQGKYTVTVITNDADKNNVGNTGTAVVDFHDGNDYVVTIFVHWAKTSPVMSPKGENYALMADPSGVGYMAVNFGAHADNSDFIAASMDLGVVFGAQNAAELGFAPGTKVIEPTLGVWIFKDGRTAETIQNFDYDYPWS